MASAGMGSLLADVVDKQKKMGESKATATTTVPPTTSSAVSAEALTPVEEEVVGQIEAILLEEEKKELSSTSVTSVDSVNTRQEQLLYEIKAKDALVRNLKVGDGYVMLATTF